MILHTHVWCLQALVADTEQYESEEAEEDDFSSVGDDVPDNVDDSWSSDSMESDMEAAEGSCLRSSILM